MEIKAQDLRYGNYIQESKTGIIYKNSGTLLRGCYVTKPMQHGDYFLRYEEIEPILLTEEWLLKFGFKKKMKDDYYCERFSIDNDHTLYKPEYDEECDKDFDINEFVFNNDRDSDAGCYFISRIRYVHQLQNLYFALNQTDLTIK